MGVFNFVMKRGSRNLAQDFVNVFDQLREIYPAESENELLKLLVSRFKSSQKNALEFYNFLQDKSFWDNNPSLEDVIFELVCLHLYNSRINSISHPRGFNATKEGVHEVLSKKKNES